MDTELAAPIDDSTRTFHQDKTSEYYLPNDQLEHSRLDTQALHVSYLMKHRILHSPIERAKAHQFLDIGCGTGYVTDTLARQFPDVDVFGLDLSPVPEFQFPRRPPNVHFLQGNVLKQSPTSWTPEEGATKKILQDAEAFDFVFHRFLISGIEDWPTLVASDFRFLKRGAWAEIHDLDPTIYNKANDATTENLSWWTVPAKASEARGIDYRCATRAQTWMKDVGFVDITVEEYHIPLSSTGLDSVELQAARDFFAPTLAAIWKANIRRYVVQSQEEEERMIEDMERAVMSAEPGNHMKIIVTYGRKP